MEMHGADLGGANQWRRRKSTQEHSWWNFSFVEPVRMLNQPRICRGKFEFILWLIVIQSPFKDGGKNELGCSMRFIRLEQPPSADKS